MGTMQHNQWDARSYTSKICRQSMKHSFPFVADWAVMCRLDGPLSSSQKHVGHVLPHPIVCVSEFADSPVTAICVIHVL